jgi:putative transposase
MKITLSVLPIEKGVKHEEYIQKMLTVINDLGLSIAVLLLDRGFYSGDVFKLLKDNNVPYIMPVKRQSNEMLELLIGRSSRFAKYTLNKSTDPLELEIAIRTCYLKGKYNKHELVNYGYVYSGLELSPYKISKIYEKRFGIESSYSIRNKVRPRTTTRSPAVRYYLFLVSMLFQNIWMMLRWKYFRKPQRGPSVVDEDLFRFDNFRIKVW